MVSTQTPSGHSCHLHLELHSLYRLLLLHLQALCWPPCPPPPPPTPNTPTHVPLSPPSCGLLFKLLGSPHYYYYYDHTCNPLTLWNCMPANPLGVVLGNITMNNIDQSVIVGKYCWQRTEGRSMKPKITGATYSQDSLCWTKTVWGVLHSYT